MRRGRWLCLVLVSCLALARFPANAAEPSTQHPPGALILYDSASPYAWLGELHALHIANLLGHFSVEYAIEPVDSYLAGEVEDYSVTFYIGDIYDNPLPDAFLADVMTTEKTICWFKYNLWQIAWDEDGYWDPAFTSRYGFQFDGMDASGFPEILYKGESLLKDLWDPDLGATLIFEPGQAEVRAVAYRPGTVTEPEASWPYVVHSGNLWYFADTPLTYISEEDRYLVFCDLLHDIVGIDHSPSRRALIRIEDVDPTCDPADLVAVADYLYSQGVPFEVAVIPVFRDPLGVLSGEYPEELRLSESPAVVAALHYMIARGGQIILHGYTHQYDAVPNPYNGLTGDDCEFFRTVWNDEGGYTEFLGPVDEDSVAWVNGRIDAGLAEMALCDLPVAAWETPHYVASALDSIEFGSRFSLTTGRVLYFSSLGPYFAGQFYPYLIESDIYGQRILPENLGNVEPDSFHDYPARFPADIVRAAEKNLVVRDAWASAYFHPYFHIKYLRQVVSGVKGLGYTYSTIPPLLAEAGLGKVIAAGGWETLQGSASGGEPPYSYSWTPTIGLDDPSAAQPAASPETTTTYTLAVTDDLGQTASDPVTVTVVSPVVAEAGPDKIIASGGLVTLEGSASGGLGPYIYSWSPTTGLDDPSAAQPTASPAGTTTYTLTVTDDLGQTASDTVTVTVASAVVAEAGPDKIIPSGGSTTLEGSASGGVPPYTYSWTPTTGLDDPSAAQPTASPAGTTIYTLEVTDDLEEPDTDTVTVTVVPAVVAEAGPDKIIASGGFTTLEGSASGGLPPYSYSWSPATGLSSTSVAQPIASPGSTTVYTLTVTDDLGQTDTDTVTVTVASAVVALAGPDKTIGSGGSTTLQGSASGGVAPYSYSWTPTTGLDDPSAAQPAASPETTTTYTLTVTDDVEQTASDTVTVTVASGLVAEAGPDKIIPFGGSTTLAGSVSGGLPPYTYSWTPIIGLDDPSAAQPAASPETTTTYTLTVTDDVEQSASDTVTVTVASAVVALAGPDKIIASGGSTTLEGSASGGAPPYTYSWAPTAGLSDAYAPQPTASPESTTTYTLTVTDDVEQSASDTVTVTVASGLVAEAGPDKIIPSGGSTTLEGSALGGAPPYTYSWTPTTGLDDPGAPQPTASPETTTTHTLTVTDDVEQSASDTVTVTVASGLVADAGPDKTVASGGSTTLEGSASGGLPPYNYSWSPTTGLDDPNIAQPAASPASTTTYTLTVTDDLGQTASDTVAVTVASGLVVEAGPDKIIPSGGSTTLEGSVSGGLPPYTYSWAPSTGVDDPSAAQPTASPTSTTTYTLTVTDDLGQTDTDTVTVTVASAVVASAGPDKTIAAGGSTTLQGSAWGGVAPYIYSWSPSTGLSSPTVAQPTASPSSTTTYTLTVTDDLGQTDSDTVTVSIVSDVLSDVTSEHWARNEIAACVNAGIVDGYPDGLYHGEWPVDRAQMAVFMSRALAGGDENVPPGPEEASFSDVPNIGYGDNGTDPHWAYKYVEYCADPAQDVVHGFPDGTYGLTLPVNRGGMAAFVGRAIAGGDSFFDTYEPPETPTFEDVSPAGDWAWCYKYVEYIAAEDVTEGYPDGFYHPEYDCTRDQMAAYICRAFDLPM